MTMYEHAGRLFLGAERDLGVQPVFGGVREERGEWFLRFMPNNWAGDGNPPAVWRKKAGRFAYCEVKLCNNELKLQISLMNDGNSRNQPKYDAFQNAAAPLARVTHANGQPANIDDFPKYWETTILDDKKKARSALEQLNWPNADIDHYLGAQIAFKLSEILKSSDFKAASTQVVATLRTPPVVRPPTQP